MGLLSWPAQNCVTFKAWDYWGNFIRVTLWHFMSLHAKKNSLKLTFTCLPSSLLAPPLSNHLLSPWDATMRLLDQTRQSQQVLYREGAQLVPAQRKVHFRHLLTHDTDWSSILLALGHGGLEGEGCLVRETEGQQLWGASWKVCMSRLSSIVSNWLSFIGQMANPFNKEPTLLSIRSALDFKTAVGHCMISLILV